MYSPAEIRRTSFVAPLSVWVAELLGTVDFDGGVASLHHRPKQLPESREVYVSFINIVPERDQQNARLARCRDDLRVDSLVAFYEQPDAQLARVPL